MQRAKFKHTSQWQGTLKYMNELKDIYVAVVEKDRLDGANIFTLKHQHIGNTHE